MISGPLKDEVLVQMIARGGRDREDAFLYLLRKEVADQSISRMLNMLSVPKEDHDQIVNDCLLALNQAIRENRLKEGVNIVAYMVGVARKIALHQFRTKSRYQRLKEKYAEEKFSDESIPIDQLIIKREERTRLIDTINQLTQSCRQILHLSLIKELNNEEVGSALGYKNDQVVRTKKSKCLRALLNLLKTNGFKE